VSPGGGLGVVVVGGQTYPFPAHSGPRGLDASARRGSLHPCTVREWSPGASWPISVPCRDT